MRIAALYDIHGNRFALDAVLAELESIRPDVILIGGDIVAGPFPREVLERLVSLPNVRIIRGNTEREVLHPGPSVPATWAERMGWVRDQLNPDQLGFLDRLPEQMVLNADTLGPTLFVHGSPRSDEEIVTALTPDARLREMLAQVPQRTMIGGHTHMQLDRSVDGIRFVNAGSVGMPYEEGRGAYWAMIGPTIEHRRTEYDLDRAVAAIRASAFPRAADFVDRYLLGHPSPADSAAFFEKISAERAAASPRA